MLRLPIILISTAAKTPTPYHYTVYQAPPRPATGGLLAVPIRYRAR